MRKLLVSQLKPGMVVGRSVVSLSGAILLRSGVRLSEALIGHLKEKGIPALYISQEDELLEASVEDVVSEESRRHAQVAVQEVMTSVRQELETGRAASVAGAHEAKAQSITQELVDQIVTNRELTLNMSDIRSKDDYTFAHSVHVGIMAIMTGISLGYDQTRLRDLGVGAILHDIGKVKIPTGIANKVGKLTPEEFEVMKTHAEAGFEILRRQLDFSVLSAHVAFQHHERHGGQGYPRGLSGDQIHEFGRIVAVVDAYDALTCDRPFRPGYLPHEAAEMLFGAGDFLFEYRIVKAFLDNVALYPVGSVVELSDGTKGVVVEASKLLITRPRIRLVWDAEGDQMRPPVEINLLEHPTLLVTRVFTSPTEAGGEAVPQGLQA